MEWIIHLLGEGKDLTSSQMFLRAVIVFLLALIMLRLTGQRTFGEKSAFDQVVVIMLGAVLSRAVTGSSPFVPVIVASFGIVICHRVLGWISMHPGLFSKLIKGDDIILYRGGRFYRKNMMLTMVSEKDMLETIRKDINEENFEHIHEIKMERSGEISIIKK